MESIKENVKKIVESTGSRYVLLENTDSEKLLAKVPQALQPFYREIRELRTGFCRFDPVKDFCEETDRNKRRWLCIGAANDGDIYFNLEPTEKEQEQGLTIAVLKNAGRSYKNKVKWHDPVELIRHLAENAPSAPNLYCLLTREEWVKKLVAEESERMRTEGLYIQ